MELLLSASPDASPTPQVDWTLPVPAAFGAVPSRLAAALAARGFTELTSVQRAVLDVGVEGRDLQISSQTGSGKTVALGFVLAAALEQGANPAAPAAGMRTPAGMRTMERPAGPEALIIVPTRELANQVSEELGWLFADLPGLRVAAVTGGTPVARERALLRRRPRVLVGTPGRLLDHVRSRTLELGGVRELVLDEADQMLDMGFREELEGILDATPAERRTHLVSATFPAGIQQLAARYQRDPLAIEGTRLGDANLDIEHVGYLVDPSERYAALVNLLLQAEGERTLVFVERRSEALEVATRLEADGFAALPLSGELAQSQRERTLAAFRAGRVAVLVATDVAARGLDVPDVGTVVHTAPPMDAEIYTHRSGRTGRAGKRGRSVVISAPGRKRRVARLLLAAGVELRWLPVPGAEEVRAQLSRRSRLELEAGLDAALAAGPSAAHLAQAEELLSLREAAPLVATLLARLEPAGRIEPQDVRAVVEHERERGAGDVPRRAPYPARPPGAPRRDPSAGVGPTRGGPIRGNSIRGGSVRFFINRGANQEATPGRLLAAICRRGAVDGSSIGSIAIHPNASTFDVQADVAEHFERLAGRRDPRDPQIIIRRDRGPRRSS